MGRGTTRERRRAELDIAAKAAKGAACSPVCPAGVSEAARALSTLPGVLGVFWGKPRRGATWSQEPALCLHVHHKHEAPSPEFIPKTIDGIATDVLAVGAPACHSRIDTCDVVTTPGVQRIRRSSITAVVQGPNEGSALLSGHGTLPLHNGRIERAGSWSDRRPSFMIADEGGQRYVGEILHGMIDARCDYALATFPGLAREHLSAGHLLARAPIQLRRTPLALGELVEHYGAVRAHTIGGEVAQADTEAVPLRMMLPDGTYAGYSGLIAVRPGLDHDRFSLPGESGSLVFDAQRRAIGALIGASGDGALSYVLPFTAELRTSLHTYHEHFFC